MTDSQTAHRTLAAGLSADVRRSIAMATGGTLVFAPLEYGLTLGAYSSEASVESLARLVAIVATLSLVLWLLSTLALVAVTTGARLVRTRIDPQAALAPGLFAHGPLIDGVRPGVPRAWALVATMLVLGTLGQRFAAWAITSFKEPQLTAIVIAAFALVLALVAGPVYRGFGVALAATARELVRTAPSLASWSPLGRWRAAGIAMAAGIWGALAAIRYVLPQSHSVLPSRLVISAVAMALGMGFALLYQRKRRRQRRHALALALASCVLVVGTLRWWGGDLAAKYIAITASPPLTKLISAVRIANDFDRDGYGSLLGENDCEPFDRAIHPGVRDKAGDGIDQDCSGGDLTLADLVAPPGPTKPVPPQFVKDWNILFLTIDTVRYDRTTFGGYAKSPAKRDTTPRLAELVEESTSFVLANAPSAGTMASIPAILTSKYFHSGIALDEKRPAGSPPGILPENTTLPEIMKRKGYRTGVIGSHEWWTGWGLEQGVDDYDNSIGAKADPKRITADKVTNHALAWISRQQGKKWFLWAHYIDPHGYYMAHPDIVDYGSSDPDKYDAELRWTDREVGRLLDELKKFPSHQNTIVIITSDHGESMGEHNVPLGTHGSALYQELIHVPMIFFIPGNRPRLIQGAVTNLDIFPTIAALCGIDIRDLQVEGKSLVPQLFYGLEERDRVVFAETNAPGKQRAAISERWKLIYYLSTNVTELFDLKADPLERTNLAPKQPPALAQMKGELERWMSRVLYARDPLFNQAFRQMADVLVTSPPTPPVTARGALADGNLEVIGIGPAEGKPIAPGAKTDIHVFFRVKAKVALPLRFQLVVYPAEAGASPEAAVPTSAARSALRATADGAYAADRWQPGEYVRERFTVTLPAGWRAPSIRVGLSVVDPTKNMRLPVTGTTPTSDPTTLLLGTLPLGSSGPPRP